jgi:hypothetical protein
MGSDLGSTNCIFSPHQLIYSALSPTNILRKSTQEFPHPLKITYRLQNLDNQRLLDLEQQLLGNQSDTFFFITIRHTKRIKKDEFIGIINQAIILNTHKTRNISKQVLPETITQLWTPNPIFIKSQPTSSQKLPSCSYP